MPEPQISLNDRATRREQIDGVIAAARGKGEPILRVRIPLGLYEMGSGRNYLYLRDAVWNLQLPLESVTPDVVEQLITAVGVAIAAIADHGSAKVVAHLETMK